MNTNDPEKFTPSPRRNNREQDSKNELAVMGFIAEFFAALPRKRLVFPAKERVWFKIQNHLRATRLLIAAAQKRSALVPELRFHRLATALLAVVIAISLVGGASIASEGSLPGDTLYPVKKAAEKVEKILATNEEAKIKVGVKHARRRLEEVRVLVAENKENKIVTESLEALKTATEQVIQTASESKPELKFHAADLVAEETQILDTVKDKVAEEVKEVVEKVISVSQESIGKLQDTQEQVEGVATEKSEEEASSTPATAPSRKPKIPDGVLESNMQIHGILKAQKGQPINSPEPEVLAEPSLGF